jgi:uroporphyrinogen-III synthase
MQQVPCFCIGQTTADHAKQKGYEHTHIPEAPSEDILLKTIVAYYSNTTAHVKE